MVTPYLSAPEHTALIVITVAIWLFVGGCVMASVIRENRQRQREQEAEERRRRMLGMRRPIR